MTVHTVISIYTNNIELPMPPFALSQFQ